MVRKAIFFLIGVPSAFLAVAFSVANRQPVTLHLDPFGYSGDDLFLRVPLFLVIFASVLLGVLISGLSRIGQG